MEGQRNDGRYRPTTSKASFAEYLRDSWLPSYRTQVRSTYNTEKTLGKWVLTPRPDTPFLGRIPLRKVTVGDFDRPYVTLAAQGMQARGIAYFHGLLKRALKVAVQKGELPRNPAAYATLPKPDVQAEITDASDEATGPVQALTKEQAVRFLAAANPDSWSALWHLLLDGGLRPGEAFALKWRHVDWERGVVQVRGTLVRRLALRRRAGRRASAETSPRGEWNYRRSRRNRLMPR
jgi:integrase